MKKILKRLEIVKQAILIEDEELILMQVSHLEGSQDQTIESILTLLSQNSFQEALDLINEYSQTLSSLVVYEDEKTQGLKFELKVFERQVIFLSCLIEEYHNAIHDFNIRYQSELGDVIQEILLLREEFYEFMSRQNKEYEADYLEAKQDFEEFNSLHNPDDPETIVSIDDQEKKELKRLYRKASRLCHPDIINEDKKKQAGDMFKVLNSAYQKKDVYQVSKILDQLIQGEEFVLQSDTQLSETILKDQLTMAKKKIDELKIELKMIKQSDTFCLIQRVKNNMSEYFSIKREELLIEKEHILSEIKRYQYGV